MANELYIPASSPVKFVERNYTQAVQYESRHDDDYLFSDTIRNDQVKVAYRQKWTINDAIKLQFQSNFDPIQVQIIDQYETVYLTQNAVQVKKNKYREGFYIYENTISLAAINPGTYYLLLTLGGTTKMVSEPFEVFTSLPYSLLFEYSNTKFHGGWVFETGLVPAIRVEAKLNDDPPAANKTGYINQKHNPTLLSATPYRTYTLVLGYGMDYGIPAWLAHKINWIFSCDSVLIDGKSYAVIEGNMEGAEIDPQYPMKNYSIKVQEGFNRTSKTVGVETDASKRLLVSLVLDSTIHGDMSEQSGSNLITITSVE